MNKFSFLAFALALTISTGAIAEAPKRTSGKTDIIRIDGTVFKAPDTSKASRVRDDRDTTKARRSKVKETPGRGDRDSGRSGQAERKGTTVLCETVVLTSGAVIGHGCK